MSQFELTNTRMANGVWEGALSRLEPGEAGPDIRVFLHDQPVDGVEVTPDTETGTWAVKVPIPVHAIADGVHTFTISERASGDTLGHFTLIAGDVVADDIRVEMELLRAELDMLKRAFRRHCVETT